VHYSHADVEVTEGTLSLNKPKNARAKELARKFISCNPFFTVVIKSYNLTTHGPVRLKVNLIVLIKL